MTGEGAAADDVEVAPSAGLGDDELRARAAKVERKPPLYRAFRVVLYGAYAVVAAWLVGGITIAVWASVYGAAGASLRAGPPSSGSAAACAADRWIWDGLVWRCPATSAVIPPAGTPIATSPAERGATSPRE